MRLVVVTGRSGAGKSTALRALEDIGFCCVDNVPSGLLKPLLDYQRNEQPYRQIAVGVDIRTSRREINKLSSALKQLQSDGIDISVLFLDASDEQLVMRYNETRRRHPLTDATTHLTDALHREREVMSTVCRLSDRSIDTSAMTAKELKHRIQGLFDDEEHRASLLIRSFGFKNGAPMDADFIFDVRCLPNPYYVPELRSLTGSDQAVQAYLEARPEVCEMVEYLCSFLDRWLPDHVSSERSYVSVAIGCTGGKHRSVYIVERLREHYASDYPELLVVHRDKALD